MYLRNSGRRIARILPALALGWTLLAGGCSKPMEEPVQTAPAAATATSGATDPAPQTAKPESGAAPKPDKQPAAQAAPQEAGKDQNRVVAKTRHGEITLQDINYYARTGLCTPLMDDPLSTDTVETLKREKLEATVKWIGSRMAAVAEVKEKNDPELNKFLDTSMQQQIDNVLFAWILQHEIMDEAKEPTEEEIAGYYQKAKSVFYQPFSFSIQMLLLQTYEPHIVAPGDTLEGIAQLVNGDAKAADNIRADLPGRPLRREPDKLFKALVPGEKLLVPMNEERAGEVRDRLEAMLRDVRQTTDTHERALKFDALAKKYDESGLKGAITTPLPTGTKQSKPPLSEIVNAVTSTTAGDISQVFRTKHGFQALNVIEKVEAHTLPLSQPEVRKMIVEKLTEDRKQEVTENFIGSLMDNPKLSIDYQSIIQGGTRLTSDTVVATLGADKLPWRDVQEAWKGAGMPRDELQIRKVLARNQSLTAILFRDYLKPQIEDTKSELAHQVRVMRTAYLGTAYISKLGAEDTIKFITPEKAKEYYEKNKDALYKRPAMVTYTAACWPLAPEQQGLKDMERRQALQELQQKLGDALGNVKTIEDFERLKAQLDEKMQSQGREPIMAETPVPLTGLPQDLQEAIARLQPGKWSEPVITTDQGGVMSVLLNQLIPAGHETYEEAKGRVHQDLFKMHVDAALRRYEDEFTQRAGVELVIK